MIDVNLNDIKRKNLMRLMEERSLRPIDLARLIDRDQVYVLMILNDKETGARRNIGNKILKIICEKLNVDESEMYKFSSVQLPEKYSGPLPVISWVSAGLLAEASDEWPPGVSGEGDPVHSYKKTGPNAFGLRVEGDSMYPRYLPGDIIVDDPEIACDNGCPCVAVLNGEATFKFYYDTKDAIILRPMNNKYPEIVIRKDSPVDFRVVGKVVDVVVKI